MLSVYHMTAFTIGFVMDLLFGDPYWLPHPIRWIGRLIGWLDRKLLGETDGRAVVPRTGAMRFRSVPGDGFWRV